MSRLLFIFPLFFLPSCTLIAPAAHLVGKAATTTIGVAGKAANAGIDVIKNRATN